MPPDAVYIGTAILGTTFAGGLVWHLFSVGTRKWEVAE